MRFGKKKIDLEPTTGEEPTENNALERSMGLGKVGTIFASGAALFSDGYANAVIGPVGTILKTYLYPDYFKTDTGITYGKLISSMAFAGIIIGQLSFGWISDKVGRKFGMLACTVIVFLFSALSAASKGPGGIQGTVNALIAYRFFIGESTTKDGADAGIGIGGEYPTGSVAAAESTEDPAIKKSRQQKLFVFATNTQLDLAFAIAYFTVLVLLWIFGMDRLEVVWRVALGLGIVPPLFLLWFRLKMKEPEAYRKNSMKHAKIPYWLIIKRYWVRLLAVSVVWFLYDWITYPFGIYAGTITDQVDPNGTLYTSIGWGTLINAFYVPGTIAGAFIVDYLGPKYCLIFGLVIQAIFGFALSGAYNYFVPNHIAGFAVMYGIFLAFGEVGPGNNIGLLASKAIGPTAARGQLYGIAAAIGKVGGFIGTYTFGNIQASFATHGDYVANTGEFWLGSSLAIASAIIALIFIPNIKPDAMAEEDILFREYLIQHGYDVSKMGSEVESVHVTDAGADEKAIGEEKART